MQGSVSADNLQSSIQGSQGSNWCRGPGGMLLGWIVPHGLLTLLPSYSTQEYQPGVTLPLLNWAIPQQMFHRLARRPVWWRHVLNWVPSSKTTQICVTTELRVVLSDSQQTAGHQTCTYWETPMKSHLSEDIPYLVLQEGRVLVFFQSPTISTRPAFIILWMVWTAEATEEQTWSGAWGPERGYWGPRLALGALPCPGCKPFNGNFLCPLNLLHSVLLLNPHKVPADFWHTVSML